MTPASQRGVILMKKAHKNLHLLFSSLVMGLWVPIWLQDGWNHRHVGLHLSRYAKPNAGPWPTSLPSQEGAGCTSYLVTYPRRHCFLLPLGAGASSHSDSPIQEAWAGTLQVALVSIPKTVLLDTDPFCSIPESLISCANSQSRGGGISTSLPSKATLVLGSHTEMLTHAECTTH